MTDDATLTISIPYYHDFPLLQRAVRSVLAQDIEDWQLLIVDDAGPDAGAVSAFLEELDDPRIRSLRNERNLGLAGNWNRCFDETATDLVTLLHSDDELEPGYARTVVEGHRRHPDAALVYTGVNVIGMDNRPTTSAPDLAKRLFGPSAKRELVIEGDDGLGTLMRGQFIFCPAISYKRSIVGASPFDPTWSQVLDLDLLSRLLFAGNRLVGLPERAYRYRRHPASVTAQQTKTLDRFGEEFDLYAHVSATAAEKGWSRTARVAGRARSVRVHLLFRAASALGRGKPADTLRMLRFYRSRRSGGSDARYDGRRVDR